jgi:hypothetical protein
MLAATALMGAGCTDIYGHTLTTAPPVKGNAVYQFGDSLTNRENLYGNLGGQMKAANYVFLGADAQEGHQIVGGPQPDAMHMLLIPSVRKKIAEADMVIEAFGTNPRDQSEDAQTFKDEIINLNKAVSEINPKARRFMPDLATGWASMLPEFSKRNQMIYAACADPDYGCSVIPRYEKTYGGNAQHMDPNLRYAPIDMDMNEGHVHDQTIAGWQWEVRIEVETLELNRHPTLTSLYPSRQTNGRAG